MEAINDASRLIAKSLVIIKEFNQQDWYEELDKVIEMLEEALEKVAAEI